MDSRTPLTALLAITLRPLALIPVVLASIVIADTDKTEETLSETAALENCNHADVRAWRIIRVGQASLALPECQPVQPPFDAPLRLTFSYQRSIPGEAFRESSLAMLERNLDADRYQDLKPRIEAFNEGYRDTDDGDVYQLHFASNEDFILTFNDEIIAREQGDDFANAYLSIWFGDKPFSARLKSDLLGD